ncbi:MAG TPA: ABC transporter ATP-binding protein [Actinomycetota bacterium]|nr:ABC transporter ATP-binding protein [Actinomycetota bacterium]
MSAGIEARNVTLRYGDTTAVDSVSFNLKPGTIHGLIGRNGSGKTSLLSVIAAFRKATSGQVLFDGEPVWENPQAVRRICFIRGSGDTVAADWPSDRVSDAVSLAAAFRPEWDSEYAAKLIDRFRLNTRAHISKMSQGQRSALGVVLGLASRCPLTIFDETYLGMDAPSRYVFYEELLADYLAHPRTFVVSTHLIEEVASLFEEVAILDRGRLLLQEDVERLRSRGASITGPAGEVDQLAELLTVLSSRQLGPTRSVTVYGDLDPDLVRRARAVGLELGPISLQDLFVHLTEPERTTV